MEGPSLVILTEELESFIGREITDISGNSKQDIQRLDGKKIKGFKSWGKHFLICFEDFTVKIHFLMFGSYRINELKELRDPRLSIQFENDFINFYSCSIHFIEGDLNKIYDWRVDIMSPLWDQNYVSKILKNYPDKMVCDILMDQNIFSGVGNIIKNEVLFNIHMHPETILNSLKPKRKDELIFEARSYSFKFYEWKKIYELKKHWQIYKKRKCRRCEMPVEIRKTGKSQRGSYFCSLCQARQ